MNMLKNEGVEVSWFAPLCNGDDEFLGDHNPKYKSCLLYTSDAADE